jgi:hypothetical protein
MSDLPTDTNTNANDENRPQSKLLEMCIRGRDYREDHDVEMFGETTTIRFRPLLDPDFLAISTFMKEHLDLDVDEDAVEAAEERIDEARTKAGEIDLNRLDREFVLKLQEAMVLGVTGSLSDDGEFVEHSEADNQTLLQMVGGYSVELGMIALDVSGNVRDATNFRGSRGGQRGLSPE